MIQLAGLSSLTTTTSYFANFGNCGSMTMSLRLPPRSASGRVRCILGLRMVSSVSENTSTTPTGPTATYKHGSAGGNFLQTNYPASISQQFGNTYLDSFYLEPFFICFHKVSRRTRHPYLCYSGTNHGAKVYHL